VNRNDRVLGGLFGVACGDALGGTLEFISKNEGRELYGYHKDIIGGGVMNLKPGEVTDDTMMTIAVAEGILSRPDKPIEKIGEEFVSWYKTNPRDIGNTCKIAIENFINCGKWEEASNITHKQLGGRSGGNGTLMRCIPVALFYKDFYQMLLISRVQSQMTHKEDTAATACALYNTLIFKYLKGEDKIKALEEVLEEYSDYEHVLTMTKRELEPSGYVVDSLLCALWCFINNSNTEDIICEAVNLYGDPDTIGAIAGGLAGVYYGYESIPDRWKDRILVKDKLIDISKRMLE